MKRVIRSVRIHPILSHHPPLTTTRPFPRAGALSPQNRNATLCRSDRISVPDRMCDPNSKTKRKIPALSCSPSSSSDSKKRVEKVHCEWILTHGRVLTYMAPFPREEGVDVLNVPTSEILLVWGYICTL